MLPGDRGGLCQSLLDSTEKLVLVVLVCLDHVLVNVQIWMCLCKENNRCMLRMTLIPGSCSTDRNPEGAH